LIICDLFSTNPATIGDFSLGFISYLLPTIYQKKYSETNNKKRINYMNVMTEELSANHQTENGKFPDLIDNTISGDIYNLLVIWNWNGRIY
jgi:hypothetical protein